MFFVVVRVSLGVIRVVVVGGGGGTLLSAELDWIMMEGLLEDGGLGKELVRERLLIAICEKEDCEFVVGMIGKLLDGGMLEVMRVVLESGELLDSRVKLEDNVELSDELGLGDELEMERLLVVEKKISLLDDEGDEAVVVKKVDIVVFVVVERREGDEVTEVKLELELELELGATIKELIEVVVALVVKSG
jgi:hypothetical protein